MHTKSKRRKVEMKKYRKQLTKRLGELPKCLIELIYFEKIIHKKQDNTEFSDGFYLEFTFKQLRCLSHCCS